MNVSQFVSRCRSALDDARILKYTDNEIVLMADEQLRYLTRKLTQTAKDWSNFSFALKKADAREIFKGTWEWVVPTWVMRVSRVYHRQATATTETSFSPYRWSGNTNAQHASEIEKSDTSRRSGWTWEGQRTMRLWNFPEALDLSLEVVKLPAPLFQVRIVDAFTGLNGLYFPTAAAVGGGNGLVLGEHYSEEGAYINAEIQCSDTVLATSTDYGETRRVIYSFGNVQSGGRKTALYVDRDWPLLLAAGDTVESLLPIPVSYSRLLHLLVLRGLSVKKGNLDLQKSIGPELDIELRDFLENAGLPKDSAGPYWKTSRVSRSGAYDQDRLNSGRLAGW